jgi:hypothetical protein
MARSPSQTTGAAQAVRSAERVMKKSNWKEETRMTKREALQENRKLRRRLEEVYDIAGDVLGFDDQDPETSEDSDNSEE